MSNDYRPTPRQRKMSKLLVRSGAGEFLAYGGGRSGKTIHACRILWIRAERCPGSHHAICRNTFKDCRQKIGMVTMRKLLGPQMMDRSYELNRTDWIYTLPNGSEIWLAGIGTEEEADKLLGTEFSTIFYNECNQMHYLNIETTYSRLAEKNELKKLRLYDCNPKKKSGHVYTKFFRGLHPIEKTPLKKGSTSCIQMNPNHNPHIDETYIEIMEGTTAASQKRFIKGEFSEEDEGKVFELEDIHNSRVTHTDFNIEDLDIIVIGVDPNVKSKKGSDDCGIVIAGRKSGDRHIYILRDATLVDPKTTAWAEHIARMYEKYNASYVVAEVNNGGDLVKDVIQNARDENEMHIAVKTVHAHQGKFARADPVSDMYQLGLVHHVGKFEELETQMVEFDPDTTDKSPDRMDALVYAVTFLTVESGILCSGDEDQDEPKASTKKEIEILRFIDVYTDDELIEMGHLWK